MGILRGNAIVGQSGGPTAAINATLAGVIEGAINSDGAIGALYGMRHGVVGLLEENIINLSEIFASPDGEGIDCDKPRHRRLLSALAEKSCRIRRTIPNFILT